MVRGLAKVSRYGNETERATIVSTVVCEKEVGVARKVRETDFKRRSLQIRGIEDTVRNRKLRSRGNCRDEPRSEASDALHGA